jgi:cation diffusion facilitator family transporter
MFVLTITTATIEIVYGIRVRSNSLIADGLYSFAEGICLIGVMLVLRYSYNEGNRRKHNTFGYERSELLFGLIQEVILLSISLDIIVDAINHLINPVQVHDPQLMIVLGGIGIFVGMLGMAMFWGYHHDHNIEEEINERKKADLLAWSRRHSKSKHKQSIAMRQSLAVEAPLITERMQSESINLVDKNINNELRPQTVQQYTSALDAFTYENVEIGESRIYATLHALCLHSFASLFLDNKK